VSRSVLIARDIGAETWFHPAESTPKIRRPVLRYHGGKFRLAPMLLTILPEHRVYTEAFGGGASVLMQKPRCQTEIYNDLDGEVVNVFRVLQHPQKAARLEKLLRVTPYARQEFLLSYRPIRSEVERARRTIIRSFMGFGSDAIGRMNARGSSIMKTGFRWKSIRSGSGPASDWMHYPMHMAAFTARLQGVVIEQSDALTVIEKMDSTNALHYVDPPYPMSTLKKKGNSSVDHRYRHTYTDAQHTWRPGQHRLRRDRGLHFSRRPRARSTANTPGCGIPAT
jgi:DNA adenine methylase